MNIEQLLSEATFVLAEDRPWNAAGRIRSAVLMCAYYMSGGSYVRRVEMCMELSFCSMRTLGTS